MIWAIVISSISSATVVGLGSYWYWVHMNPPICSFCFKLNEKLNAIKEEIRDIELTAEPRLRIQIFKVTNRIRTVLNAGSRRTTSIT